MLPTIRVDSDVYEVLKHEAEPFVDTPNSVLRRLLGLGRPDTPAGSREKTGSIDLSEPRKRYSRGNRLEAGKLLPHSAYVEPILRALEDRGGSAPVAQAIEAVGEILAEQLKEADWSLNNSGGVRWKNRTQWVRQKLVDEGLLSSEAPRGIWSLTDAGRARLKEFETGFS